jgi:hypothetical protein
MTKRRKFSDQFKAKVALAALRGDRTIQEIAAKHRVHPNQVSTWRSRPLMVCLACSLVELARKAQTI